MPPPGGLKRPGSNVLTGNVKRAKRTVQNSSVEIFTSFDLRKRLLRTIVNWPAWKIFGEKETGIDAYLSKVRTAMNMYTKLTDPQWLKNRFGKTLKFDAWNFYLFTLIRKIDMIECVNRNIFSWSGIDLKVKFYFVKTSTTFNCKKCSLKMLQII